MYCGRNVAGGAGVGAGVGRGVFGHGLFGRGVFCGGAGLDVGGPAITQKQIMILIEKIIYSDCHYGM